MRRKSITVRLTLLFATASTAVLIALGYWIGVAVEAHFVDLDREELDGKMELVTAYCLGDDECTDYAWTIFS